MSEDRQARTGIDVGQEPYRPLKKSWYVNKSSHEADKQALIEAINNRLDKDKNYKITIKPVARNNEMPLDFLLIRLAEFCITATQKYNSLAENINSADRIVCKGHVERRGINSDLLKLSAQRSPSS